MKLAWAVALVAALAGCGASSALAAAGSRHRQGRPARAPSGPALTGPSASGEAEQGGGIQSAAGDQLAENGLYSPLCKSRTLAGLSAAARSDCRASGFVAAAAPSNDYALDVHIDTGALGLSKGELLSVVQDLFITPVWGALEWVVHAVLVLLEWCYTLELLGGSTASAVTGGLEHARASFTDPWLALALSLAAMLALYHGLVRRRVADTLGGVLTMLAMMAGGLWVIADPAGTVGTIGRWANQASVGTLAATVSGTPGSAVATLGDSMRALYAAAIETPWCYLEFGNVRWCSDPAMMEPGLRAAALALMAHEGGHGGTQSAALVRSATTNGALFLAFPANGPARNSINDEGSLLRAICHGEDATKCSGPAAAEAEFRTDGGTLPRVLGLLAIAAGVLGMALLFGLLALRLLAGAFLSLLLLLLAPFAVLAPAFGDGGRAVFGGWLSRLLGAVSSKLLFSFVLGALLTMQRMLIALDSLGWWTQWLLVSAFWWIVFLKRDQAAAVLRGASRAGGTRTPGAREHGARPSNGGTVERSLRAYGTLRHPARWVRARVEGHLAPRQPLAEERLGGLQAQPPRHSGGDGERPETSGRPGMGESGEHTPFESKRADWRPSGTGDDPWFEAGPAPDGSHEPDVGANPVHQVSVPRSRAGNRDDGPDGQAPDGSPDGEALGDGHRHARGQAARHDPAHSASARGSRGGVGRPARGGHPDASTTADRQSVEQVTGDGASADSSSGGSRAGASSGSGRALPERSGGAVIGIGAGSRPSGPAAPVDGGAWAAAPADGEARSPIMEDAFAVAERRKRQLGFERQ